LSHKITVLEHASRGLSAIAELRVVICVRVKVDSRTFRLICHLCFYLCQT